MAKQKGLIKIDGTLGDITFYQTRDGYLVREKGNLNAQRILSDPAFIRTRENNAEFGRAGTAGKILRNAFRAQVQGASDGRMVSRLTTEMFRVIRADETSDRGKRNVIDGEAELLEGFDFNASAKLGTTLYAPYTATIDRSTGVCTITLPPFLAASLIAAPGGTTHFKLVSAAASIDFEAQSFVQDSSETGALPLSAETTLTTLTNTLAAASTHPLFLVLGILFYQEVNGTLYPLKNGAYNALSLIKVDSGV